jgi:hypothetical protein
MCDICDIDRTTTILNTRQQNVSFPIVEKAFITIVTFGSVHASVCASIEATESIVGAIGVALSGRPTVALDAGALGVRPFAGSRAGSATVAAVAVAAVAAKGALREAVVLLAHGAVNVVPEIDRKYKLSLRVF